MTVKLITILVLFLSSCTEAKAHENAHKNTHAKIKPAEGKIWDADYIFTGHSRPNPHNIPQEKLSNYINQGLIHTQKYPIESTGVLLPERPIKNIIEESSSNVFKKVFINLFKGAVGVETYNDLFYWLGLIDYPLEGEEAEYNIPFPEDKRPEYLIGYSKLNIEGTDLFTMSCATCHSGELFGKPIIGMTKRFPRANAFFIKGAQASQFYNSNAFKNLTKATDNEMFYLERSLENLKSVGLKMPLALGLDTSLAQVSLSLNKREPDEWATKSSYYENHPRPDILDSKPGDSKPAVWWNLKYKTRWLSDGSVVSGNPIVTNILWNEIGRGSDLKELEGWLKNNDQKVKELTTAVFSTKAPRIEDFFDPSLLDEDKAYKGEKIFNQACSKCHGTYKKNWSLEKFKNAPWSERIKTHTVDYPKPTKVKDVGTDPYRYITMKSLEKLNELKISKDHNVVIKSQKGYVPPPLVGIWARWPYLHNNSIPNLCALMTPPHRRPQSFFMGAPIDKNKDFDFDCNGYPTGRKTPLSWINNEIFLAGRPGLSNSGHYRGIFTTKEGEERFTQEQKQSLIVFLQTL